MSTSTPAPASIACTCEKHLTPERVLQVEREARRSAGRHLAVRPAGPGSLIESDPTIFYDAEESRTTGPPGVGAGRLLLLGQHGLAVVT